MKKAALWIIIIALVIGGAIMYIYNIKEVDKNEKMDRVNINADAGTGETTVGSSASGE